jgi:uncharacterized protein YcaQ
MLELTNREMRRALLVANGLAAAPAGDPLPGPASENGPGWVLGMVRRLGSVQIDSIAAVERAHHHILFARNPRYRQDELRQLCDRDRAVFETWTHDAAFLPVEAFPYWRHYFARAAKFVAHPGYRRYFAPVTARDRSAVLGRLERDGPLRPRDLDTRSVDWHDAYFARPSLGKLTLELLWRTGKVAVTRREGQEKVYDLAERVIPAEHYRARVTKVEYVDWACREALERLVVATPAQIARFFDAVDTHEAARWCARERRRGVVETRFARADGATRIGGFALEGVVAALRDAPAAPRAPRLLNPFDPLIHDRQRTRGVFGFDYTVEIWVPASKRRYGYYVLPILEGERFVGRLDAKVDRSADRLRLLGLWWEPGVRPAAVRSQALAGALRRLARFTGVSGADDPSTIAARTVNCSAGPR